MELARRNIMLGTAGHVDHGKTALVKLLTGCDTDRLEEEKRRGLTIELGFAPCRMGDGRVVGVVDVPGHVDFIRNMVAGAHGIDVVILVVAADDGVMPQTREHLDILTLLGVRTGLVALTKIDLVDPELRELARQDVRGLLAGTFLADGPICPVSNITGEGYDAFFDALNDRAAACPPRTATGLFRMWVERSFHVRGFGQVASGIPAAGTVRVGDRLRLLGGGQTGRVRSMEVYGTATDQGRAGECVALNLADVSADALARGSVLTAADGLEAVSMFEAQLALLGRLDAPLKDYAEVHLHIGTAEAMAHVALLAGKVLPPGGSGPVQLRLAAPAPVAAGERFVIRGPAADGRLTTLGGGRVLGAGNIRLRRGRPWTLEALERRRAALDDPARWCAALLAEVGGPLSVEAVAGRALLAPQRTRELLDELVAGGEAVRTAGGQVVHSQVVAGAEALLCQVLAGFHDANPMREGIEPRALQESTAAAGRAAAPLAAPLVELALERLIAAGAVQRRGGVMCLPGRGAKVSAEEDRLVERVASLLAEAHLEPPLPAELAASLEISEDRLERIVRLLADRGEVVRLDRKVVMHRQAVEVAARTVRDLFAERDSFETVEFRDRLGVSRKYAVPLLDYFDTRRLTVRSGNRRRRGAALFEE